MEKNRVLILDSSGDALRWEAGEIDRVGGVYVMRDKT